MLSKTATEWLLDDNGARTGPHSVEQLEVFIKSGRLGAQAKVTSPHLNGSWISVNELMNLMAHTGTDGSFQPPPRPSLPKEFGPIPPPIERPDPLISLFDALQAARDRKKPEAAPDPMVQPRKPFPTQAVAMAGVAVVAGAVIWIFASNMDAPTRLSSSESEGQPAAIARPTIVSKPVAPASAAVAAPVAAAKPISQITATGVRPAPTINRGLATVAKPTIQIAPVKPRYEEPRKEEPRDDRDRERDRDREYDRDIASANHNGMEPAQNGAPPENAAAPQNPEDAQNQNYAPPGDPNGQAQQ